MRRQPRIDRAVLFAVCLWSWGCRTYQPVAPAEAPPNTTVVVTFQAVRDWMVPGSYGRGGTGLLVVGVAVALWAAVMASSCIMCGFGDGDVVY